jgi:hypothetical protein
MPDDAMKRTLEKLTAYENREKELARKDAQIEKIQNTKNKRASLLWNALVSSMAKLCADCSSERGDKKLEFKADGSNQFQVVLYKLRGKITLQVVFEPESCEVSYTRDFGGLANVADKSILEGKSEQYFLSEIDGDDFSFTHQDSRVTVEQMGETMIEFLLDTLSE